MRLSKILGSIQTFITGLISGIFIAILVTEPARLGLELSSFVKFQQDLHLVFGTMMPPFALASILVGFLWMVLLRKQVRSVAFFLVALSMVTAAAALVVSFRGNFPINDILMTWDSTSPPVYAKQIWLPWETAHIIRSVLYVISFVSAITANSLAKNKA